MDTNGHSFSLAQVQPPEEYRQTRAHVLPSKGAVQWFIRQHKKELVDAGALLVIRGQWYVDPPKFDAVFLNVAQRDALSLLSADDYTAHAGA